MTLPKPLSTHPAAAPEPATGSYPSVRLRRNRQTSWSRRLVAETVLTADDLIWPLFVIEGKGKREPVASMPGVERLSVDLIVAAARIPQQHVALLDRHLEDGRVLVRAPPHPELAVRLQGRLAERRGFFDARELEPQRHPPDAVPVALPFGLHGMMVSSRA